MATVQDQSEGGGAKQGERRKQRDWTKGRWLRKIHVESVWGVDWWCMG